MPTLGGYISTRKSRIWKIQSALILECPQESIRVKKYGGKKMTGPAHNTAILPPYKKSFLMTSNWQQCLGSVIGYFKQVGHVSVYPSASIS